MTLLELRGVSKSFSGITVLKDINLALSIGEIHVLLGENGAGKSTLIKLLTGAHRKDEGTVRWKGEALEIENPQVAIRTGIACIYQELNLIPELTVYENVFLGRELKKKSRLLDIHTMREKTAEYIEQLGLHIRPDEKISSLGMGQRQLIEIARALSMNAKLIIMDEPTSSLSEGEVETLLSTVEELKQQGITILYISHKLEELKRVGDRISILRDGAIVGTYSMQEMTSDKMIRLMVGRDLKEKYPKKRFPVGEEGLRVAKVRLKGSAYTHSFTAYKGQVLGIAGLVGAGRTELIRGIFGVDQVESGEIHVFGKKVHIRSPQDAIRTGLALISENRKEEGILPDQSIEFNITVTTLSKHFLINRKQLEREVDEQIEKLHVYPKDRNYPVGRLSGGNQQKVIIGKWLATKATVYLFDEPTRGIDVGAKVQIYHLVNHLVEQGSIVIIVSSELPEILGICDRVLVMREGQITADLAVSETDQEEIMRAATGGSLCRQIH